jgi:hypothetical protein
VGGELGALNGLSNLPGGSCPCGDGEFRSSIAMGAELSPWRYGGRYGRVGARGAGECL